jgi:HlyD family secretion protein
VDNPDLLLRPGMTATARIVIQKVSNAVLVPNIALRFVPTSETAADSSGRGVLGRLIPRPPGRSVSEAVDQSGQRAWVLHDGAPVAIPIEAGATNGIMTEVVKGDLEPGTRVIIDVAGQGAP